MSQRVSDIVSGGFLLVAAIAIHLVARGIERRIPMGVDSGYFPEIASFLLGTFATIVIVKALAGAGADGADEVPRRPHYGRVAGTMGLIVVYGLAVPRLGFLVSTAVYLVLQFALLAPNGERRWVVFAGVAIGAALLIFAIFSYGFSLILPSGIF